MMVAFRLALGVLPLAVSAGNECFGRKQEYQEACEKITNESTCEEQIGCLWGDPTADQCVAKDPDDQGAREGCKKKTNETACNAQIACVWRSHSDLVKWKASVSTAVSQLQVKSTPLPSGVSIATPTFTSSHDFKAVDAQDLSAILKAWQQKYDLPGDVVSGLGVLVAAESADFKEWHHAITPKWDAHSDGAFRYNGKYLKCESGADSCTWDDTFSQTFRKETGDDNQFRFKIYKADGSDTNLCLDREHCHSSTSNLRAYDCGHCGAIHWQYDGSKLAEDGMRNCVTPDNGGGSMVAHCSDRHADIQWPIAKFDGQVQVVGAGGRNYNGQVQVAFAYSTADSSILAPGAIDASGQKDIFQNLQADLGPKVSSEAQLLYQEMQASLVTLSLLV